MGLFLGTHTLYSLQEVFSEYDLDWLFQKTMDPENFNDSRLGNALDAIYDHAPTIYGDIITRAIREFKLDLRSLNLDGTKILLYGEYDTPENYMEHAETIAYPMRGWNHEGRKDLKQLSFQLMVTGEQIPVLYSVADGNASETEEYQKVMKRLHTINGDLQKSVLVADSKMCSAPTLIDATEQKLRLVTLVPDSFSIRKELIQSTLNKGTDELVLLMKTADGEEYRGMSYRLPILVDLQNGDTVKTEHVVWRYLVVHSSRREKELAERRVNETADEKAKLEKRIKKFERDLYFCEADAKQATVAFIKALNQKFHAVEWETLENVTKPGKGRTPAKGAKISDRTGWGIKIRLAEKPPTNNPYSPEAMFVLLTTVSDCRILSDADILEGYKGRNVVEMCFKWMKGPAAVAPVFLKYPSRIQALGFVLVVWMLVYALIQREIRRKLQEGEKVRHPGNKRTEKPTTRGVLQTFSTIGRVLWRTDKNGGSQIQNFTSDHQLLLNILGIPNLYQENLPRAT